MSIALAEQVVETLIGDQVETAISNMTKLIPSDDDGMGEFLMCYAKHAKRIVFKKAAAAYDTLMTEDELQQVLDFYGTPAGKALSRANNWLTEHPKEILLASMDAMEQAAKEVPCAAFPKELVEMIREGADQLDVE